MSEFDEFERDILLTIEESGWFRMGVVPRTGHPEDGPQFAYSIGFTKTLGVPEVIVLGLNIDVMHQMLWGVFNAVKSGKALADGERWDTPLQGYVCETRSVHESHLVPEYFNSAMWYWDTVLKKQEPFEAYQLFWPGAQNHLLPWEAGASHSVIDAQPRLDLPNMTH